MEQLAREDLSDISKQYAQQYIAEINGAIKAMNRVLVDMLPEWEDL